MPTHGKNIFADKATFILRKVLSNPEKKWVIRDFTGDNGVSLGMAQGVLEAMANVVTDQVYVYFRPENWKKEILNLRQQLDLKELVRGGNIHVIRPVYKNSVFYGVRTLKGHKVVSGLQLYLDLFNFKPRGREHAEYLKKYLEEKGKSLYEF